MDMANLTPLTQRQIEGSVGKGPNLPLILWVSVKPTDLD
jgi:hypothetical protein